MGIKASNTAEVHFDEVKVPKENLLGGWRKIPLLLMASPVESTEFACQSQLISSCWTVNQD